MNEPTEMLMLIPAKGLLVRDPMTGLVLPPEGGLVPKNERQRAAPRTTV